MKNRICDVKQSEILQKLTLDWIPYRLLFSQKKLHTAAKQQTLMAIIKLRMCFLDEAPRDLTSNALIAGL